MEDDEIDQLDPNTDDGQAFPSVGGGALSLLPATYADPEAKKLAKRVFNEQYGSYGDYTKQENDASAQLLRSAEEAKQALIAARQKLASKKYSNAELLLSMSAAFGRPTRTGGIGETIGNVAGSMIEPLQHKRAEQASDEADSMKYQQMISGIDTNSAARQMQMAQARRTAANRLISDSLKIMAKESRPGAGGTGVGPGSKPMSNFGKIAQDAGYTPGTPEYNAVVRGLYNKDMKQRQQASGVDTPSDAKADAGSRVMAYQMGVPVAPPLAVLRQMSTKQKQVYLAAQSKVAQARLKEYDEDINGLGQTEQDLDEFMEHNKQHTSGPMQSIPGAKQALGLGAHAQRMDMITANMARKQRVPGEGQVSNFDAQQFLLATISRGKLYDANKKAVIAIKAGIQARREYDSFMNAYFTAHGHLTGAQNKWNEYKDSNPIFDRRSPGTLTLNPNRISYKEYFRKQNPVDQDPALEGLSEEEKAGAMRPAMAEGGAVKKKPGKYQLRLDDLARHLAQGSSFNFSDEILASLGKPEGYEGRLQDERKSLQDLASEYPITAFGTQMMGALPTSYAGAKLASHSANVVGRGKGKVAAVARALARAIPSTNTGQLALAGGLSGAVGGLGASQGDEPGVDTFAGGVIGTVAGPLGGLATKYGIKGLGGLWDLLRGQTISRADRKLLEAATKDNTSMQSMLDQMKADQKANIPTMLGDTGGEHVAALTEATLGKPGTGPSQLAQEIATRQAGAPERVGEAVNRALKPDAYYDTMDKLTEALYTNAKPLYQKAYEKYASIRSKTIANIAGTKWGRAAVREAIEKLKVDGKTIGKVRPDGSVARFSLEGLDMVKRSLDDQIKREEKDGFTDLGRLLRDMRNGLRGELDALAPEYKAARAQYAGDLEVRDALELGREKFVSMPPGEAARLIKDMSFAEKDALRTGVAESLFNKLGNTPHGENPAKKIIGTPAMMERLGLLFDSPRDFKKFLGGLEREFEVFRNSASSLRNARPSRVRAAAEGLESTAPIDALRQGLDTSAQAVLLPGVMQNTGTAWSVSNVLRGIRQRFPMMTEDTANELARALAVNDPKTAKALIDRLISEEARLGGRNAFANRSGSVAARASAVTAQPPAVAPTDDYDIPSQMFLEREALQSGLMDGEDPNDPVPPLPPPQ